MTEPAPLIRVMIADDHIMFRSGLEMFVKSCRDMTLVGSAVNGVQAVALANHTHPDVILMDIQMPELDGVEAARRILSGGLRTRIIALTSYYDEQLIYAALKAGMVNYLVKDVGTPELATAIREAYAGRPHLSPDLIQAALRIAESGGGAQYHLTDRERDVLRLMVRGLSNRQISHELTLGESTIKFHVSNILSKLEVSTRTEAVALAVKLRLV